jgi:hypothetical protein
MKLPQLIFLDAITLPCHLMSRKGTAKWHLKHICPNCPKWRRAMRDVNGTGECWWFERWSAGDYTIDPHFGVKNWIRQYLGMPTDLRKWKD